MSNFQTIIFLMFIAIILVGISQKLKLPYPVGLVIGGSIIGFVPINYVSIVDPPQLLLLILPPVLFYAAFEISYDQFKTSFTEILSLSLGLVIFNTLLIGVIFYYIFPQVPLALAFAFGAIVSPPDAVSASTILKRFQISNKLLTILEGESLINDASALILYKMAVSALLFGVFSIQSALLEFVTVVIGAIFVGLTMGMFMQLITKFFLDHIAAIVFSFTLPYMTYIIAEYFNFSGVLAVVVCGVMTAKVMQGEQTSVGRIIGFASWDIFIILVNCFIFILIGLQMQSFVLTMGVKHFLFYSGISLLITIVMFVIRAFWVYAKTLYLYYAKLNDPEHQVEALDAFKDSAIISWSAMRGIVSLTAALGLPYVYPNGALISGRSEVVFVVFMTILLTLIIPSLTLPKLIKILNLKSSSSLNAIFAVKQELIEVGRLAILKLRDKHEIKEQEYRFLGAHFDLNSKLLFAIKDDFVDLDSLENAKVYALRKQRQRLLEIWQEGTIDDKTHSMIEHELDLEDVNMARAELI